MSIRVTDIIIICFVAAGVLLAGLGSGSLNSWDEAFYAEVSREILESGDWVDLTWSGAPWSDKPPLYMWVTAFFYMLFGTNEFSARLFSALAGGMSAIVVYLFGNRFFSRKTGLLSAIMLLSTYHYVWISKMGMLDVVLGLFTILSVYFFLLGLEKRYYIVLSLFFFSLAFMTKGTAAFIIPMAIGIYVIARKRWDMVFNGHFLLGIAVIFLIAGSWYLAAYLRYGDSFISGHFLDHLVKRTTTVMDGHEASWITYVNAVLYKGKPWGTVGLILLPYFISKYMKKAHPAGDMLVIWTAVVLSVFTFAKTKLHWYIIPVYPALALIAARGTEDILKRYSYHIVIVVSFISLLYIGGVKGLYSLDFNPGIKNLAEIVREEADPGVRFYFGDFAKDAPEESLAGLFGRKDTIIVTTSGKAAERGLEGRVIQAGRSDIVAITKD